MVQLSRPWRTEQTMTAISGVLGFGFAPTQANDLDLVNASISDLKAILGKSISAEHLVDVCTKRIEEVNSVLHAVISIDPTAREQAKSIDKAFAEGGDLGCLAGIPFLIKDHIDVKGLPTTHGSHALATAMPRKDATLVRKLKAHGAIILGKSNESEWGFGRGTNGEQLSGWSGVGGQCLQPYYKNGDPIGSSGGSAVAVAVGLVPAAIGSELWGSINCPAMANIVCGLCPTYGLVSRAGSIAADITAVTYGPLCKTAADVAICMTALAGRDDEDPVTLSQPKQTQDYTRYLSADALKGTKIGVEQTFSARIGMDVPAQDVIDAVESIYKDAIADLRKLGAEIIEVNLDAKKLLLAQEQHYMPAVTPETAVDFERWCKTVDGTPIRNIQDVVDFNKNHPELEMPKGREGRSGLIADAKTGPPTEESRKHGQDLIKACYDEIQSVFDKHNLAAIVTKPTLWNRFTSWSGHPEVSVPFGHIATFDYHPKKGVPLQFIGRKYEEARLLSYASAFQEATGIRSRVRPYAEALPQTQL